MDGNTYVDISISLYVVDIFVVKSKLTAASLCRTDDANRRSLAQFKWASEGNHPLASSKSAGVPQFQRRQIFLAIK